MPNFTDAESLFEADYAFLQKKKEDHICKENNIRTQFFCNSGTMICINTIIVSEKALFHSPVLSIIQFIRINITEKKNTEVCNEKGVALAQ